MSFFESLAAVGLEPSTYDATNGWPKYLDLERLVFLQYPESKVRQTSLFTVLRDLCVKKKIPWKFPKRPANLYLGGEGAAFDRLLEATGYAISGKAFSCWLNKSENQPSSHISEWLESWRVSVASSPENGLTDKAVTRTKPLQRGTAQENAILNEIRKKGIDPLALPPFEPGKPSQKRDIRRALSGEAQFKGNTIFDKAWERLMARKDICYAGKTPPG